MTDPTADAITERLHAAKDRLDAEATRWKTRLVEETAQLRDSLAADRAELARVTAERDEARQQIRQANRALRAYDGALAEERTRDDAPAVPGSPTRVQEPDTAAGLRVVAVVNWRKQRVHGITCDAAEAQRWIREIVAKYGGDSLAATQCADVVQPPAADTPTPTQRVIDAAKAWRNSLSTVGTWPQVIAAVDASAAALCAAVDALTEEQP